MNRPSYKELWLYEHKDRDEQLQWIRDAVDGNAKFCNSEPPYSEEEELARKIMQMHARIAELEAAQRWIPVSERLPEDGETVFVIIHDGFERFENGNEVARLTYLGNGNWWSWGRERYVVTHWMPLPNPPEVQE